MGVPILYVFDWVVKRLISVHFWLSIGGLFLCSLVYTQIGAARILRLASSFSDAEIQEELIADVVRGG